MRVSLALLALFCVAPPIDERGPRFIDIYIYETYRTNHTMTFYSWIDDSWGGDSEIEGTAPEIEVGWLQAHSIYLTNKGGSKGEGIRGQSMVLVTIAGPPKDPNPDRILYSRAAPIKIRFGKLESGHWDGKIHIELPYDSTYKVRRTVNIRTPENEAAEKENEKK